MDDPVEHEGGKGWFFWDEVWAFQHGFWDTEEEARKQLNKYCVEELGIDIPSSEGVEDDKRA